MFPKKDIRNSPSFSVFKKNILNFIRPCSNCVLNASHLKGPIFLTHLHVGLNHLREHTLIPICNSGFDIETLNHFFLHCPRFTSERHNLLHKIERVVLDILEK